MNLPVMSLRPRVVAPVVLVGVGVTAVLDALRGGWFVDGPSMLLAAAGAVAVGFACRTTTACLAGAFATGLLTAASQIADSETYSWLNDLVFFAIVVGGPVLVGGLWAGRQRQVHELERLSGERAAQRAAEIAAARQEEQNRISRSIHDDVIQAMGAISLQAAGATRTDRESAHQALDRIEQSARQVLDQLREHLGVLRTSGSLVDPVAPEVPLAHEAPRWGWIDLAAAATALPVAVESVFGGGHRGPVWANLAMSACLAVPLALRRRHPIAAATLFGLLGAAASSLLTPLTTMVTILVPMLLVAYAVGGHVSRWHTRLLGGAAIAAGVLLTGWASPPQSRDTDGILPTLLWLGLAILAGAGVADRADRLARTRRLLDEVERGRATEVRLARAEHRAALARDLHDSVATSMTVVCLHASAARQISNDDEEARAAALATVTEAARAGVSELRTSLDLVDGACPSTTPRSLEQVISDARLCGLDVRLRPGDAQRLLDDGHELVTRVIRECLVNSVRHAPGSTVEIRVDRSDARWCVEVTDGGAATSPGPAGPLFPASGHGLSGLAERVTAAGGELVAGPVVPRGFRVVARIPSLRSMPS